MRKRFEQQNTLDADLIPEIEFDLKSRHQLPQLLAGLQYIFITPDLNEAVFEVLEKKILGDKKRTGRLGMSLWEILVLGAVRLNMDYDYDAVHDLANHHEKVRGIMGVQTRKVFDSGKRYVLQTLKDNVSLLDELTLQEISELVVKAGHKLKKNEKPNAKEATLALRLKTDTYAVETTVHFPTDINLLWDSARKCMDTLEHILKKTELEGWRKLANWYKKTKQAYRKASDIHRKKGGNYKERLHSSAQKYLGINRVLSKKIKQSRRILSVSALLDIELMAMEQELAFYHKMLNKHIDLVERRIIKGEKIPHSEKVFSIFETHTEWLQKGKQNNKVELGHNVLITTDQYHFIVDHKVLEKQTDVRQPIELSNRLQERFAQGYTLDSISFDRGFYSLLAKKALSKGFNHLVMPKKGNKTASEQESEADKTFVGLRKKHSAVESNINELECSGVNKVPDKGIHAFKRYVALGVLAYNLKRLGRLVIEREKSTIARQKDKLRAAA